MLLKSSPSIHLHRALDLIDEVLLLEDVEVLLALVEPRLRLDAVVNVLLEVLHWETML